MSKHPKQGRDLLAGQGPDYEERNYRPGEFTNRELADCANREVKQRGRVYPRLVEQQKISQAFADRQMKMMKAIAGHFEALAQADEAKERLF